MLRPRVPGVFVQAYLESLLAIECFASFFEKVMYIGNAAYLHCVFFVM